MRGGQLTPRQREIVALLAGGDSCPQVARRLAISVCTVRAHVRGIASRLHGAGEQLPALRLIRAHASELLQSAA